MPNAYMGLVPRHTLDTGREIKLQRSPQALWGCVWVEIGYRVKRPHPEHTVDYDPFIKSQLASHNQFQGLTWCKFGHVTP